MMAGNLNGQKFSRSRRAVIAGTGSAVPSKVLTNADLEKLIDTSDEWITSRTGIKERRIAANGETTASLSIEASKRALEAANIDVEEIDLIICATITPEMVCPATACIVQEGLGLHRCSAFDLMAACSGFTYAVSTAGAFISSGQNNMVLVIGAETLSTITDFTNRSSCILFGDGAGAVLLRRENETDDGLVYSSMHADGAGWETIHCKAYGSLHPAGEPLEDPLNRFLTVNGRETYQLAVRRIVELIEQACEFCQIGLDDVSLIIPHQMNARIIESVCKRLKVGKEKMYVNIERYGNTSAASIPIAMDEAIREGRLKKGDLLMLVSFGAGLTWALNLIRV